MNLDKAGLDRGSETEDEAPDERGLARSRRTGDEGVRSESHGPERSIVANPERNGFEIRRLWNRENDHSFELVCERQSKCDPGWTVRDAPGARSKGLSDARSQRREL